jgi:hypothetical protein
MNTRSSRQQKRTSMTTRYVETIGKELLSRPLATEIPSGWAGIVADMFRQIRSHHPGAKIVSMHVDPSTPWGSGKFDVSLITPSDENSLIRRPKLSRSLRWITMQARKKALSTCCECGHPLGKLHYENICLLCACRSGIRTFT